MGKYLHNVDIVETMTDQDFLMGFAGNIPVKIHLENLKKTLVENNDLYLRQVAFFIDINEPGDTVLSVNVGGNREMFKAWEALIEAGVQDQEGNWAPLSRVDNRYFADGSQAVDLETREPMPGISDCNFVSRIPQTGCYVQTIEMGGKTINRLWLSLLPLPGWQEPAQMVGMFKGWVDGNGRLRSVPNKVPTRSRTVQSFWDAAQNYGEDYGLAGVYFRNFLLWYMMAKYSQRGSQECKLEDGTPVWGVGLDGSESATHTDQYTIPTGATLVLGTQDGKVGVRDSQDALCHSVKVAAFENPWGQFWEFDGHLCSFDTDVFAWRENFMPSSAAPVKSDFASVKTMLLKRHTATITSAEKMNIITGPEQGVFMFPYATQSGISYGDRYNYGASGQVWRWGGYSESGADCGLAWSNSSSAWTLSSSSIGARLAYFGPVHQVTGRDLLGS